jgi:chitodextrinase
VGFSKTKPAHAPDTEPPTIPSDVVATSVASFQINVSWEASTDNKAVSRYVVLRNGQTVGTTPNTTTHFSDTGLPARS